ncbi:hypothetical protein HOLleu_08166 [Holothuria leucospilota]|uniref:Uncharacterized protein n=1 Tax=Holothuria leucospilota TaxID=206669 RepID=A0A9Q1HGQ3_HOLLE|nr:hypothetical protein HOLleu_08166 [Holothuria leucospilota]
MHKSSSVQNVKFEVEAGTAWLETPPPHYAPIGSLLRTKGNTELMDTITTCCGKCQCAVHPSTYNNLPTRTKVRADRNQLFTWLGLILTA